MQVVTPDNLSFSTYHLNLGFTPTNIVVSTATGFAYRRKEKIYLITNWHNVSGRNSITGEYLSETLAIPDVIVTVFREKSSLDRRKRKYLPLYNDENLEHPLWFEHPHFGNKVDVVAIPLPKEILNTFKIFPVNDYPFEASTKSIVGDDIFVIGYPFAEDTIASLPIWKRASIASEPDVNYDNLPKILIDTATRSGLSGSPVIMQRTGIHGMINGEVVPTSSIGTIRTFIGVYSGRIGAGELRAQLGIVWKSHVIDEIIDGAMHGSQKPSS